MKAILLLIKFELKQRLTSWISLIFFLMLLFQAIWYTKGTFDYYVNEGVLMNAPAIIYVNYSAMGMLMVIVIAIATGGVLYKDIQHKTADWIYTFPVNEKQFYLGRFSAAFLYLFILAIGATVGHFLLPYSGIGASHRFGSPPILEMIHAIIIFQIPNLLLYTAVVFTAVVLTKKMAVGYLAVFLMVVIFLIMQSSYDSSGGNIMYTYADPMGYVSVQYYYDHVPTELKNSGLINLTRYILINRVVWLSVTVIIFLIGYRKFSFKHFISKSSTSKIKVITSDKLKNVNVAHLPKVEKSYLIKDFVLKLISLSKLEFLNIVRPMAFKIIVAVLMFMVFMQNVSFNANYYIGAEVPLTSNMTFFRLAWSVFIIMLLIIWSGELFFKEKTVKIWQITDALPVPVWVTQLSKFVASCGLAFVLCLCFVAIGVVSQIILGGVSLIDIKQYVIDVFGYRWGFLNFVFQISLVFFIAGLTGNRFLTHILSVGYFLFLIISFDIGVLEQIRYAFGFTPGVEDFSEMSSYGILGLSANWFALLWGILSIAFVMLGILFWRRGAQSKWYKKIVENQLSIPSKIVVVLLFIGFFVLQSFIHKNIYANGNYVLKAVQKQEDTDYENKYAYLSKKILPKYKEVNLLLDYFPAQRKVNYNVAIGLSALPKDTLFLSFKDNITLHNIKFNKKTLTKVHHDIIHNVFGYLLNDNVKNDSVFNLEIKATKQYIGLSQSELHADITANGSYASIKEFLPTIGYDYSRELIENRTREDNGLDKLKSRMPNIDDTIGLHQLLETEDALKVKGSVVISTSITQTALGPGVLVKKETKDNRNYFTFKIDTSTAFNWYVGSAEYEQFTNEQHAGTTYQIYADEKHHFNIEIYNDAIKKSLDYLKQTIPSFNVENIALYEKHHWAENDFDAFANTIVISEKHGWVADTSDITEKSYIYQIIVSQIFKLWIAENLSIANVQGAGMINIAIPEAFALLFVEKILGNVALEHLLKKKNDKYAKDRNNEPNTEPALVYADGIEYLEYNKGAIHLYKLIALIGKQKFIETLEVHLKKEQPIVFKDLYLSLFQKVSSDKQKEVKENFEAVL